MTDPQDEIARIRKRKRVRNMLNCSGNTTDNLCFRYRFRDVFSRFRCCVYNGTGPLLRKHNGNMELHVSATFPFTDSCNFVLCEVNNPGKDGGGCGGGLSPHEQTALTLRRHCPPSLSGRCCCDLLSVAVMAS